MKINDLPWLVERSRGLARILSLVALVIVAPQSLIGAEQAVGVLLYEQASASQFHYNIDLKNSGTTNVGTLWYSWVLGEDFLGVRPTNPVAPPGWTAQVTNLGANDGFAVQWINNSGPLPPGQTLSGFGFDITATPTVLTGSSPFFSGVPISTTFIYGGAPFSDAGFELNINPTAHPWQNPFAPLDVNNDGMISPADVLLEISALVSSGIRTLGVPTVGETLPRFADTNGDGLLSPADLLAVISQLDGHSAVVPSFEMAAHAAAVAIVPEPSSARSLLLGSAILATVFWRRRMFFAWCC